MGCRPERFQKKHKVPHSVKRKISKLKNVSKDTDPNSNIWIKIKIANRSDKYNIEIGKDGSYIAKGKQHETFKNLEPHQLGIVAFESVESKVDTEMTAAAVAAVAAAASIFTLGISNVVMLAAAAANAHSGTSGLIRLSLQNKKSTTTNDKHSIDVMWDIPSNTNDFELSHGIGINPKNDVSHSYNDFKSIRVFSLAIGMTQTIRQIPYRRDSIINLKGKGFAIKGIPDYYSFYDFKTKRTCYQCTWTIIISDNEIKTDHTDDEKLEQEFVAKKDPELTDFQEAINIIGNALKKQFNCSNCNILNCIYAHGGCCRDLYSDQNINDVDLILDTQKLHLAVQSCKTDKCKLKEFYNKNKDEYMRIHKLKRFDVELREWMTSEKIINCKYILNQIKNHNAIIRTDVFERHLYVLFKIFCKNGIDIDMMDCSYHYDYGYIQYTDLPDIIARFTDLGCYFNGKFDGDKFAEWIKKNKYTEEKFQKDLKK
eukprot:257190_1